MYGLEGKKRRFEKRNETMRKNDTGANRANSERVNRVLQGQALKKFGKDGDSRSRMQAFLAVPGEVPNDIKEMLMSGKARLIDHTIYSTQPVSNVIKFFESQNEKKPGFSNNKGNSLGKGEGFLVNAIRIRTGVAAGTTDKDIKQTDFKGLLDAVKSGHTAHIKFTAQSRNILQEMGTASFINVMGVGSGAKEDYGVVHLDNPRFISDAGEFLFEIHFGDTDGTAPNTRVLVELIGSRIVVQ